ncbi:MAG TPA: hypothetical protein VGH79_02330 [Gaiellaceae bacterium]|jgi:hypothetical protein
MSKVTRWIALSVACTVVVGVAATAATARSTSIPSATTPLTAPLATGVYDSLFTSSQQSQAFAMSSAAGATYARIDTTWKTIAPSTLPSSDWTLADQANPNSPYYHWGALDATVEAAEANGIKPILDILGTPSWAYHVQPSGVGGGQPDVNMLGAFAKALALRYNGSGPAPAVHAYSTYNEVNFNRNFSPQDPTYYRYMVNAVADSVHAVDSSNLALAGELAPYKHASSKKDKNNVIAPITWMQKMLCVSSTSPAQRTCAAGSTHFDVWTHHPYSDKGPFGKASVAGGVELGDLPKMNSLLKTAYGLGAITTESGQAPQFWVTEIGWSSNPPNKHGVGLKLLTRWTSESLWQVWKSGATLGTWFLLQDKPLTTPFQSGLYFLSPSLDNAVAKSTLPAFQFPFVAYHKSGGKVAMWGRDPHSDAQTVTIQRKSGSSWKTVGTITTNSYGIFQATMSLHSLTTWQLRATTQGMNSAPFSLTVPSNENMNVTPFPLN